MRQPRPVAEHFLLILAILATGCALPTYGPGDGVEIVASRDLLPKNCEFISAVNATDGASAQWRYAYVGSTDRALERLRYEAVRLESDRKATHLVLTEGPSTGQSWTCIHCPRLRGQEVFVRADAFSCAGEIEICEGVQCGMSGAQFLQEQIERSEREGLEPHLEVE